jgi:hypothetical protein
MGFASLESKRSGFFLRLFSPKNQGLTLPYDWPRSIGEGESTRFMNKAMNPLMKTLCYS